MYIYNNNINNFIVSTYLFIEYFSVCKYVAWNGLKKFEISVAEGIRFLILYKDKPIVANKRM